MTADNLWVVVPAAGVGSRMGAGIPKQYLTVAGETVLSRTLKRLLSLSDVHRIVVAISAEDRWWPNESIGKHPQIQTVSGGAERADSVLAGLKALAANAGPDDWVMVHDAARPCVQPHQIEDMRKSLQSDLVGGLMAIPVADTLKRSDSELRVSETIDRRALWAAQTPQVFRYQILRDSLERALAEGIAITDEASAVEWAGFKPRLFPGSNRNIKITVPEDIELAAMILDAQPG
ncbi:2-C-methyl-D-erythritol 4-phosphate cytidylyltransferase [Litorivivens sp.]|uniref:2-C-methyl-D-erythritol 4-phosphate cytidylyltransferase n=4 Tax=Litorivivens sp. TaxID=2020868 RepID=UPI003564F735